MQVDTSERRQVLIHLLVAFDEVLVQRCSIQRHNSSHPLGVVAADRQCQLPTYTMSGQSGGGYLVLPHESGHVICHISVVQSVRMVAGAHVPGVQHVDVALLCQLP